MASPAQLAKKSERQTAEILEAVRMAAAMIAGLKQQVAELNDQIAELKDAFVAPKPARGRQPNKK